MKIDIQLRRYRSVTLGCLRSHLKKDNSDLEQNGTERKDIETAIQISAKLIAQA